MTDTPQANPTATSAVASIIEAARQNPTLLTLLVLTVIGIVCMWFWVKFIAPQRQVLEDKRVRIAEAEAAEAASMAQAAQATENTVRVCASMMPQMQTALTRLTQETDRLSAVPKS